MGGGSWTADDWKGYHRTSVAGKATVDHIYTSKRIDDALNPKNVAMRESCDSDDNPNSTAVIVGLDVTGSMGNILDSMARDGLDRLVNGIYERKPIANPHVMFMGIGDSTIDNAPLQVTQFEADIRIAEQMTKVYFEKGGGGNNFESYPLAWYFAANHTKMDCFDKRGQKGFLFTMGDDGYPSKLSTKEIENIFGYTVERDITVNELLNAVSRRYEIFHMIVTEGNSYADWMVEKWRELLGERALLVSDYKKIPEIIISTLQVMRGDDVPDVVKSWDGTTALVVQNAIGSLSKTEAKTGLVEFQ